MENFNYSTNNENNDLKNALERLNQSFNEYEEERAEKLGFASAEELWKIEEQEKIKNKEPYTSTIKKIEWIKKDAQNNKHGEYRYDCFIYVDRPILEHGKEIIKESKVNLGKIIRREFDVKKFTEQKRNKVQEIIQDLINNEVLFEFKEVDIEFDYELYKNYNSEFTPISEGRIDRIFKENFRDNKKEEQQEVQTIKNSENDDLVQEFDFEFDEE